MAKELIHVVELIEAGEHEGDMVLTIEPEERMLELRDEYLKLTDVPNYLDFVGFLHQRGAKLVEFQYDIVSLEKK